MFGNREQLCRQLPALSMRYYRSVESSQQQFVGALCIKPDELVLWWRRIPLCGMCRTWYRPQLSARSKVSNSVDGILWGLSSIGVSFKQNSVLRLRLSKARPEHCCEDNSRAWHRPFSVHND